MVNYFIRKFHSMSIEKIDARNYIVPFENDNLILVYIQAEYIEAQSPSTNISKQVKPIFE